jgi:Glutaminase
MNHTLSLTSSIPTQTTTSLPVAASQSQPSLPLLCRKSSIRIAPQAIDPQQIRPYIHLQNNRMREPALPERSHSLRWMQFFLPSTNAPIPPHATKNKTPETQPSARRLSSCEKLKQYFYCLNDQTASNDQASLSSHDQSNADQQSVLQGERLANHPSALSDITYDLHQGFIQYFLQQTQITLTDYFDSLNDSKVIEIDEIHPSFIAMPMDYQQIEAVAKRAFTNSIYAKDDPRDGCYARAELATIDLDVKNQTAGKIFVTGSSLFLPHPHYRNITWRYHVAAAAVSKEGVLFVIDPCVDEKPMLLQHWLEKFVAGDTVNLTFTHAQYQYTQPTDFTPITGRASERIKRATDALDFLAQKGYAADTNELDSDRNHFIFENWQRSNHSTLSSDLQFSDDQEQPDDSSVTDFTLNLM